VYFSHDIWFINITNYNIPTKWCPRHRQTTKQTQWPLVRKRTIPTELPPLVGES
jgi:hypothetical protein